MTASGDPPTAPGPLGSRPSALLFPDLDQELATLRRFLERYPDGKGAWAPHEKSMTLSHLATHLARLPNFGNWIMDADELDMASAPPPLPDVDTARELLARFDSVVDRARTAVDRADLPTLQRDWTFRVGDQFAMAMPKFVALRNFLLNHIVHHRAQLGVYYRLLGLPVPKTYGPSADEA